MYIQHTNCDSLWLLTVWTVYSQAKAYSHYWSKVQEQSESIAASQPRMEDAESAQRNANEQQSQSSGPTQNNGSAQSTVSADVLRAIYGSVEDKRQAYEASLRRWWHEYADRKNDEEDEYVANSLLYDRNHLPRTAPAPDCVAPNHVVAPPPQPQQQRNTGS